jgi:(2Fe-2S) ferredoxin
MIVGPGSYMYLDKEKIDRILKEHIIEGNLVKEYLISEEFLA